MQVELSAHWHPNFYRRITPHPLVPQQSLAGVSAQNDTMLHFATSILQTLSISHLYTSDSDFPFQKLSHGDWCNDISWPFQSHTVFWQIACHLKTWRTLHGGLIRMIKKGLTHSLERFCTRSTYNRVGKKAQNLERSFLTSTISIVFPRKWLEENYLEAGLALVIGQLLGFPSLLFWRCLAFLLFERRIWSDRFVCL